MKSAQARRNDYKNRDVFQSDQIRSRRQQNVVDIRKQKREENVSKKRTMVMEGAGFLDDDDDDLDVDIGDNEFMQQLFSLAEDVRSSDVQKQFDATTKIRKLLSREVNPPIDEVLSTGVVGSFVQFLRSPHNLLQFEAAWALTNIASGSTHQTKAVVDAGALPIFVELLQSSVMDVKEQAVWALGNIAGDSSAYRDLVLMNGVLHPLLDIIQEEQTKITMLRNATWTLSNLCRGKQPSPKWDTIKGALPVLAKLLYSKDEEVLIDACWALSYISDSDNNTIQSVIESGVSRRLIELLMHPSPSIQTPALRSVGNIVTGDDNQTQIIINCGALTSLLSLLGSQKETIQKEACWTLSNITAGNVSQIQSVIDANIFPTLIHLLAKGDQKTRREACWAVANALSGGQSQPEQIHYLVSQGCIGPLCGILETMDSSILMIALDGLEYILKAGQLIHNPELEGRNSYALEIETCGGMDTIHRLQEHKNEDVYKKAYQLIDKYFTDADDMIDAPPQEGYTFSTDVNMPQGGFNFQ